MRLYWRRFKMFFLEYWIIIAVITTVVTLLILSYIGMSSLDSFYRKLTIAQLPVSILTGLIHAAVFVFMYTVVLRGGFSKMGKLGVKAGDVNVSFDDVIGIDEAKEEAWEVVELIQDRQKVKKIGGKILKGLLMVGPPGCGKTLLAKAIATEAGIPFMSIAGSEFVEVFVGVGASRVRKLFKKARSLAHGHGACIIFIDELDVIAQTRQMNQMGGQEANATQNQLLVEMDGLGKSKENVIVIGATNADENALDPALLRPGRFDRKVYISKPGLEGREDLFRYYLSKIKYDENSVEVPRLARMAVGKSPAEIESLVKEAALIALRDKQDVVTHKHISTAMERIELGIKHKKAYNAKEKEMTAYHEVGHLVTTYILHPTDDVFKASIIPRKQSLGVVYKLPKEELHSHTKEKLLADIKVSIAGYASERIKYGTTTTGVGGGPGSDFHKAMSIANYMVWQLGMSPQGTIGDFSAVPKELLSEDFKKKMNAETDKILKTCLTEVESLLRKEWDIVERFVKELLEKEELEYDEIEGIFREYGKSSYQTDSEGLY